MQTGTDRQTDSIAKLRCIVLQLFIRNMPKKVIGYLSEMLPGIIFGGGTNDIYAKPP